MVDLFLRAVDKIIDLLRAGARSGSRVFEDLVEPLFNEMPLVVQDYLALFRQAETVLRASTEDGRPADEAILMIQERREQLLATRRKVQQLTELVEEQYNDEKVRGFARAITACFYSFSIESDRREILTDGSTLVELFELLKASQLRSIELHDAICEARRNLEHSWVVVTRLYAELRLAYLHNHRYAP